MVGGHLRVHDGLNLGCKVSTEICGHHNKSQKQQNPIHATKVIPGMIKLPVFVSFFAACGMCGVLGVNFGNRYGKSENPRFLRRVRRVRHGVKTSSKNL
jgi:hypothetical protein